MRNEANPLVYIIILNWNNYTDTHKCLESIDTLDYLNRVAVVVDNGSTDGSIEELSKRRDITLIQNKKNMGYSGGNNIGIKLAIAQGADYFWLLNSDAIVTSDCLTKLVDVAQSDNQIGLVSPIIRFASDSRRIQFCGSEYLNQDNTFSINLLELDDAKKLQENAPERMMLWGTALLVSRCMVQDIGFLDEGLFAYFEDTDYSIRSVAANYKNKMCFEASIIHDSPIEKGQRKAHYYYYMRRNYVLTVKRHVRPFKRMLKLLYWDYVQVRNTVNPKSPENVNAELAGLWHGWLGITGPYNPKSRMPKYIRHLMFRLGTRDTQ